MLAQLAKKEDAFLKLVMGEDLYAAYLLTPTAARFVTLLAQLKDSAAKISPYADWTWYFWQRKNQTVSTGSGDKNITDSGMVSSVNVDNVCDVWNTMVDNLYIVWQWLDTNRASYTEWDGLFYFDYINSFGI